MGKFDGFNTAGGFALHILLETVRIAGRAVAKLYQLLRRRAGRPCANGCEPAAGEPVGFLLGNICTAQTPRDVNVCSSEWITARIQSHCHPSLLLSNPAAPRCLGAIHARSPPGS